jgi:hypothetical protein
MHGIISQKAELITTSAARSSNCSKPVLINGYTEKY